MYIFEAHYTNMMTDEERTTSIYIDDLGYQIQDRDVYIMAMGKAYDMSLRDELLGSVEFIAC